MKKLLMLGAPFSSMEIVQKAKGRGWYTIVTDNRPLVVSPVKQAADDYWNISTAETELLEEKCREEGIDAIFTGVSEFNLDRVLMMTRDLDLPCYIDEEAWKFARNKYLFKEKCLEKGVPVVQSYPIPDSNDESSWSQIKYPVVVKPVDGTGNAGLSICNNREELLDGLRKAREFSPNQKIIIERYVIGDETWNYYFVAEGQIRYVYSGRVFRQPGYPTFLYSFGTTAAGGVDEYLSKVNPQCLELLSDVGCKEGTAWIQCIKDEEGNYYALEMALRMSADTTGDTLEKCLGFNTVDWMLDTALGVRHSADMLPQQVERPYTGAHCVYFLFANHSGRVELMRGFDRLDPNLYHVEPIVRVGDHVSQYRLMTKITFFARNAEDMCQSLQYLNETIEIVDTDAESLVIRFTDYDEVRRGHRGLMRE